MVKQTVVSEDRFISKIYEKKTVDIEVVSGLFGTFATTEGKAKICTGYPNFIFDLQQYRAPFYQGKTESRMAEDTYPTSVKDKRDVVYQMTLLDGQTLLEGDPVMAQIGTGKTMKLAQGGIRAGWCYKGAAASGSDGKVLVLYDPDERVFIETLTTPVSHVFTPTKTMLEVLHVEILTATGSIGGANFGYNNSTPAAGNVYVNLATNKITGNTTDAVLTMRVKYNY